VNGYRTAFEDRLHDTTRALALAIDAEMDTYRAAISSLGGSTSLDRQQPDLAAFRREANRTAAMLGAAVVLINPASLRQVVNTSLAPGSDAGRPARQESRIVAETGHSMVLDLAVGHDAGRPVANVAVPVMRSGAVAYVLLARMEPERLGALLATQTRGSGAFATLIDRNNIVVARSHDHERFVGQKLLDWTVEASHRQGAGLLRGRNLLGEESISAFRRLSGAPGWMVVFGYPIAAYNDALWRPVAALVIGGALAVSLAMLVASMMGRRILRPVRALTRQAEAVVASGGEAIGEDASTARVTEFERLRQSTLLAERTLRERTAEVAAGEARLRAVVDTAADAIVVIDEVGIIRSFNRAAEAIFGYEASEAIGQNVSMLMPEREAAQHGGHLSAYRQTGVARIIGIGREVTGRRKDGSAVPLDLAIADWRDSEGSRFFTGIMRDISARKAEEARKLVLMREVDHRAKNALAVVSSMVRLTPANEPQKFAASVQARVGALARAHSLLADGGWVGADLRALAERELALTKPACADPTRGGTVSLDGPPVALSSTAVQPLVMVLHELATNAAKHGALSHPGGHLEVSWRAARRVGEDGMLRIRWTESGVALVGSLPPRRGFGLRVVEANVRGQLGGSIEWQWEPTGLTVAITLPLARLQANESSSSGDATRAPSAA
jgi:PAS domain S-box-containing protein